MERVWVRVEEISQTGAVAERRTYGREEIYGDHSVCHSKRDRIDGFL
jgi:hypothetical protein